MTTTRRRSRRTRHQPALLAAGLVLAVVVGLDVLQALGWLLAFAVIGAVAFAAGRNTRPAVRAAARPAEPPWHTAERDQLAARVADLERQLADARDAAHAAWDAAASATPQPAPGRDDDAITRLLADPRSGARQLGND